MRPTFGNPVLETLLWQANFSRDTLNHHSNNLFLFHLGCMLPDCADLMARGLNVRLFLRAKLADLQADPLKKLPVLTPV
jgi:hypothetical protein